MPARTRRGRSTAPCSVGASGRRQDETPAHLPVRAAYSRAATSTRSAERRPGGRPCRAASTPKPMMRTCPWWSSSTFSGTIRPWARPASCACARLSATSETIQAARRGCSGPSLARTASSDVPCPHSLTTKHRSSVCSASRTRSRRGSRCGADAARGLEQARGPRVVARDEVHRHVPVQHRVVGPPEPAARALGEQVVEAVARGEDLAGVDRVGHGHLAPVAPRRSADDHIVGLTSAAPGRPRCRPGR